MRWTDNPSLHYYKYRISQKKGDKCQNNDICLLKNFIKLKIYSNLLKDCAIFITRPSPS